MRPGDRKQRWKSSCEIDIVVFTLMGIFLVAGELYLFVLFPAIMIYFTLRDHKRGWKIDYRLPPHAIRGIKRGDKASIRAAETTLRQANDPDRQKYAFEKPRGQKIF